MRRLGVVPDDDARREAGRGPAACRRTSASTIEDPSTPAPGRRRVPLVLLRVEPAVVEHAPLALERARAAEGVPGQAAERLFVLHHLREHRRLRRRRARRRAPTELDRWISSELALTDARRGRADLDAYDVYGATQRLVDLRRRALQLVRAPEPRPLLALGLGRRQGRARTRRSTTCSSRRSKLIAPFVPYSAEAMYQNLVVRHENKGADGESARSRSVTRESVHLERFPTGIRGGRRRPLAEDGGGPRRRERGAQGAHRPQAQGPPAAPTRAHRPQRRRAPPPARRSTSR